jgi:hypothetical protein
MMQLFGFDKHFYHGSVRRYVALFGSLFSDVYIKRKSEDGIREDNIKVPIRYGNGNMYLKVPQDESREVKQVSRILPAMAFELDNIYKDVHRKTNSMNRIQQATFKDDTSDTRKFQLNRVPYNFIFDLKIRTKNTDDMLQIVEQIVPAFDGNLSVTINDTTGVPVEQDIIIVLDEISTEDNYDEEMQSRLIEWTITFELKGHLYKRTQEGLIIREVDLMSGPNFENMTILETVDHQGSTHEEQLILAKMTDVFNATPSTPIKKVTRKRRKKE